MAGRTVGQRRASSRSSPTTALRMRVGPTTRRGARADHRARRAPRRDLPADARSARPLRRRDPRAAIPDIPRRVSGYNLDELLPEKGFNVARALVGSEGTLATVLEATVRLVHSPPSRSLLVLGYEDVFSAADHVPEILEHGPVGLEGIDERLDRRHARQGHARVGAAAAAGRHGLAAGGVRRRHRRGGRRARPKLHEARCGKDADAPAMKLYDDAERGAEALGRPRVRPGRDRLRARASATTGPAGRTPRCRRSASATTCATSGSCSTEHDYRAALYGHFGQGCVHCRIDFDLRTAEGLRNWRSFLDEAADLVVAYGGSLSGEHGDGQQRAELLPKMFGEELAKAFRQMKAIWDPAGPDEPAQGRRPLPDRLEPEARGRLRARRAEDPLRLSR